MVTVGPAPPSPPTPTPTPYPTQIIFTPQSPTINDDALADAFLTQIGVVMSDGSVFSGLLSLSDNPGNTGKISGNQILLARPLSAADIGQITFEVLASQNMGVTTKVTVVVVGPAPPPPPPP